MNLKYYVAAICENGHTSDDSIELNKENNIDAFCPQCGGKIICKCPTCGAYIKGIPTVETGLLPDYYVPKYCYNCGNPYPWTLSAIETTEKIIEEEKNFNKKDKEELKSLIPDLMAETPKTEFAIKKYMSAFLKIGKTTAKLLIDTILTFACEAVIKYFQQNQ